jgi:hypothetical protein
MSEGEQVLLKKALETIQSPFDFLRHDDELRYVVVCSLFLVGGWDQ